MKYNEDIKDAMKYKGTKYFMLIPGEILLIFIVIIFKFLFIM